MAVTQCELPDCNPPSLEVVDLLAGCRKIAVVGISPKETRDSNRVARYLIEKGYDITPVNPGTEGDPRKTLLQDPFRYTL